MGGEGDINSAEGFRHCPLQRWTLCHSFQSCWLAMDLVHCSYALMYTLHTHALTRTHILTHTLHTCCSCKGCFLGFLMREFFSTVFCWRKTRRFSASCSGANFCWGRRSMSQGLQKHFSFGQAKYSTGIYVFMWRL